MPRTKSVQAFKDESIDVEARIISAIGLVGPRNIALISRMTHVHQETVRYKIKRRFGKLGFRFQAEVDYSKLGLQLHWGTFRLARQFEGAAGKIFRIMNKEAYLIHFSKMVPQGYYLGLFALPEGTTGEYSAFLKRLKAEGVFVDCTLDEVEVERHRPMDPTFFNFRTGRWEVDWQKMRASSGSRLPVSRGRSDEFDMYDLLIIKELQINALQHVVGIAKKLKVSPKTLEYHYRTHVVGRELIPNYRTRWMQDITKNLAHTVAFARYTFRGLSKPEFDKVQLAMSKIPYLWAEDVLSDGTYLATLNIPVGDIVQVHAYVSEEMPALGNKVEVGTLKWDESSNFTVPYNMYQDGKWKFNTEKMKDSVIESVQVVEK